MTEPEKIEGRLARWDAGHVEEPDFEIDAIEGALEDAPVCAACHRDWPCSTHLMVAAIRAMLEIHDPIKRRLSRRSVVRCQHCGQDWPCKTVRAIAEALGVSDGA